MAYPHPMDDKTGFEATDEEMGLVGSTPGTWEPDWNATNEWRPIETVPRDGRGNFLVRFKSGVVAHVYLTMPEPPLAQTFRYWGGPTSGQQAGWPDHWMPLPEFRS